MIYGLNLIPRFFQVSYQWMIQAYNYPVFFWFIFICIILFMLINSEDHYGSFDTNHSIGIGIILGFLWPFIVCILIPAAIIGYLIFCVLSFLYAAIKGEE